MGQHTAALAAVRRQIADAEAEFALAAGASAGALAAAATRQAADVARLADHARSLVAAGSAEAHDAWDSHRWGDVRPGHRRPAEMRIGAVDVDPQGPLPATVPFFEGRTLVLASQGPGAAVAARHALRGLAVRCAAALGHDAVHLVDPYQEGFGFPERAALGLSPLGSDVASDLEAVVDVARAVAAGATPVRRVVLAMDFPRGYGHRAVELVNRLARLGPAGVQLVVHHDLDADAMGSHDDLELTSPCVVTVRSNGTATGPWGSLVARLDAPAPPDILALLSPRLRPPAASAEGTPALRWEELNSREPTAWWLGDAGSEVRATIGRDLAGEPLAIVLGQDDAGESRAHVVLGGEAGSGKSVLLRTLIASLATRYAPDDLRFYLIDGQNGAGFPRYRTLPHADLVALDAPVDLVRSVLVDVEAELVRRSSQLSRAAVSDIASFQAAHPGRMPRLVVVIDEYQQLFKDDPQQETARILQRITAQGRKAGVHLVLASQRFHATGLLNQDALFANIRTRIALRVPTDSLDGVDEFGREGRALIRGHCTSVGRIVVNAEGGRDGANTPGVVAHLTDADETALVADLAAKAGGWPAPVLIDGRHQPDPAENRALTALARVDAGSWEAVAAWAQAATRDGGLRAPSWHAFDRPLPFVVGRSLSVYGSTHAAVEGKPGQNVLVVADNREVLTGTILTGVASVAMATRRGQLGVTVLSELPPGGAWAGALTTRLAALASGRGHAVRWAGTDADAVGLLAAAVAELERRLTLAPAERAALGPHFVVGVGLDRRAAFRLVDGTYEAVASPATADLLRLAKEGPDAGVHVVVGFTSRAAWDLVMPVRTARHFAHRVVRQMAESDSLALLESTFGNRVNAALSSGEVVGPDRAGYANRVTGEQSVFLPYLADERLFEALAGWLTGGTP